jgi:predicted Zn-dependent protease
LLRFEATQDRSHLDRAIALCQEGLNSGLTMEDVTKASMWDTLGHAYTYNTPVKNYDRAMVFFQRGLTLTPNNPMIEMHMGGTYFEMGNLDMAFRFLEAAREGNQPEPYKFLAYVYARKGQMKEAVDSLTKYMALQPNDIDAAKEKRDLDNWKAQLQSQNTSQG